MNTLFNRSHILCAVALICALTVSALAQAKEEHAGHHSPDKAAKAETKSEMGADVFKAKGDGITTCPVSGEALASKDVKAEMFGRTVYFCCDDCLAEAKKHPAMYVKKTEAEQLAAVKGMAKPEGHDHAAMQESKSKTEPARFLGKGDGITTCPVTGEAVSKDVKAEINGRTVYFCCADCIEDVKKNPDLYLKKPANKE
jgi:YHS domain-containing protein